MCEQIYLEIQKKIVKVNLRGWSILAADTDILAPFRTQRLTTNTNESVEQVWSNDSPEDIKI